VALLLLAAMCLVAGVAGGLARMGADVPAGQAAGLHGVLMVGGFLGTVISLERAVALATPLAYGAPLAAASALLLALAGFLQLGALLLVAASIFLLGASLAIVRKQRAPHTVLLAVAAGAWLVGNAVFASGLWREAQPWWFAFLVLTIAAERLEMTRLMRRRLLAQPLFMAIVGLMLVGPLVTMAHGAAGAIVFGASLVLLAAWLATFDIARRTVRTEGFSRYAAIGLLAGYAWLVVAGIAWAVEPFRPALRDAALHALGIGFVFSMIFAHAPLIVPVVARLRMRYVRFFFVPLALLHASLLLRLAAAPFSGDLKLAAGALNAFAIVLFVATLVFSIRTRKKVSGTNYQEVKNGV
jgi:hypothetical protein